MNSRDFPAIVLLAGGLLLGAGCGRDDAAKSAPRPVPAEFQQKLAEADQSPEAALAIMNEAMKDWLLRRPEYPKTVGEFVTARVLPKIPAPPAGKEFAIDRTRGVVVLVDK
jgi:hypothetical protein